MTSRVLLDTCAAIWLAEGKSLGASANAALNEVATLKVPVMILPVIAWEVGLLVSRGRYPMTMTVRSWFESLIVPPVSETAQLTTDILINSSFMPDDPPGDPFDRLFIAAARAYGYRLITSDRKILKYAEQGHVQVIPC